MCLSCVLELCSAFIVAFGEFQMMHSEFSSLITTFWPIYPSNTLVVTGTIATCVCYIGVLGGMRENRCMLISVSMITFNIIFDISYICFIGLTIIIITINYIHDTVQFVSKIELGQYRVGRLSAHRLFVEQIFWYANQSSAGWLFAYEPTQNKAAITYFIG